MVEQQGIVVRLRDELAEVEFIRQTACGGCSAQSACGTGILGSMLGRRRHRIWLANPVDAVPGDEVVVGMREGAFVATSLIAYLLPLAALFAGALAAQALWSPRSGSELPAVLGAIAGFALGLFGVRGGSARDAVPGDFRILRKEPKSVQTVTFT